MAPGWRTVGSGEEEAMAPGECSTVEEGVVVGVAPGREAMTTPGREETKAAPG